MSSEIVLPTPGALVDASQILNKVSQDQISNLIVEEYRERLAARRDALGVQHVACIVEVHALMTKIYTDLHTDLDWEAQKAADRIYDVWPKKLQEIYPKVRVMGLPTGVHIDGERISITPLRANDIVQAYSSNSRATYSVSSLPEAVADALCFHAKRPSNIGGSEARDPANFQVLAIFEGSEGREVRDWRTFPVYGCNVVAMVAAHPDLPAFVAVAERMTSLWYQIQECKLPESDVPRLQRKISASITREILTNAGVQLDREKILATLDVK